MTDHNPDTCPQCQRFIARLTKLERYEEKIDRSMRIVMWIIAALIIALAAAVYFRLP